MSPGTWSGDWVAGRLPLELTSSGSPYGLDPADLVGLALRHNPRRAHLLVSGVLGKHVPTDPSVVEGVGVALGVLVRDLLHGTAPERTDLGAALREACCAGDRASGHRLLACARAASGPVDRDLGGSPLVLGYAETATALGHCVADALHAPYLHSTRRPVPGVEAASGFEEEHSHATSHLLLPSDPRLLAGTGPLVLVDDELSTGRTAANTIRALHRTTPRSRYVVAALLDLRSEEDRTELARTAAALGARIDVVSLASGTVRLPDDAVERAAALLRGLDEAAPVRSADAPGDRTGTRVGTRAGTVRRLDVAWPAAVPETGRHGVDGTNGEAVAAAVVPLARALAGAVTASARDDVGHPLRVLVLGTEELMYVPLRLAGALGDVLAEQHPDAVVRFSTTTRSPVRAVDHAGYAVRTAVAFAAHDDPADGPGPRWAYNVRGPGHPDGVGTVVLVTDAAAAGPTLDGPDGPLAALRSTGADVVLVVLPDAAADLARATATRTTAATR